MDRPTNETDARFRAFLAQLLEQPGPTWGAKQQMELDMARDLSVEMLRIAEHMRDDKADLENCLVLLKYAKVLDYIMSALAARRDIHPQTLRTIFKLAHLKIDDAYPE